MVDRNRLVRQFASLVAIDAEAFHERTMADYVTRRLRELGLTVTEDHASPKIQENCGVTSEDGSGNLHAVLEATAPGKPILFGAHLDTVSPGVGKKAVVHEDGTITSDGTTVLGADDAAAVAELLEALTVVQENNIPHPRIELIIAAAEEPYAQGSAVFDYSTVQADMAYVLDLSGPVGSAALAAPAILSFQVEIFGRSAHAGFAPEDGIHALKIAAEAMAATPNGHVDEITTVNFGTIAGGTAPNIVPDHVTVRGEIRSLEDERASQQRDVIREAFEAAAEHYGGRVEMTCKQQFHAYRVSEEEEVAVRYRRAVEAVGLPLMFRDTFGGSDNNHYNENGIRGIVMACAMNRSHSTEEYTSIEDMAGAAEIVVELMRG